MHLLFVIAICVALSYGTAIAQDKEKTDEFMLEEITVTAQFVETNLQKTPIAITAITGETLEERAIKSVTDLGLVIPNAAIREQGNAWGPNSYIGMRGVDQSDFIPAFEPGVVVYVDDIFNETVVGSTMDLVDLERVEVLRGPQGTLFGKNAIGGAIRLISKTPHGDNTGHLQVTYGNYHRLDFTGGYDFSLIEDRLFARISGASKKIDGFMDRLDYVCQMRANGTPEAAGNLQTTLRHYDISQGNCKIGEKGGSQSDAAKLMLRFLATPKLEFNVGVDYTEVVADTGAETLIRGRKPTDNPFDIDYAVNQVYLNEFGVSIFDPHLITGDRFAVYETFEDPLYDIRWPDKTDESYTNLFARADYDITDDIHAKFIFGYRENKQLFPTVNGTPFSFNAYLIDMRHDQTSYELRLNGTLLDERLDWTVGGYYYETTTDYLGYITLGTIGVFSDKVFNIGLPFGFDNNDHFYNESQSAFAHAIFAITDKLSFTAGGRYTDESKTFDFDHPGLMAPNTLKYGGEHWDWKLNLSYQFTDDIMAYATAATGFRSEGANPRPYFKAQLQPTPDEKVLMYEVGAKTQFFDNRLRVNMAVFYNIYDPRVSSAFGLQCTDLTGDDPGEPYFGSVCPEGTEMAGSNAGYWFAFFNAPGKSKGLELDILARPIEDLDLNASFGYYNYETDTSPDNPAYIHPDQKLQADYTYNVGAQYKIDLPNGSVLLPRLDMFYQGERTNNPDNTRKPIPGNVIPDYTLFNGRLTYSSPGGDWSLSLEAQNLFDKKYWINVGADKEYVGDTDETQLYYGFYGILAQPGRPRTVSLSLRYNFF